MGFCFNIKPWSPVVGFMYTTRPVRTTYVVVTLITGGVQFKRIDVGFHNIMNLAVTYVYLLISELGSIYRF